MSDLGNAFFQEAEKLYKSEYQNDNLPNSSALALFSMVCKLRCRWDLALESQKLCREMGERMRLFGVANDKPNRAHFNDKSSETMIASSQTAWGLYNWLRSILCRDPGVVLL